MVEVEALTTSVPTFRSRWVGDPLKEKSRDVICKCATHEGVRNCVGTQFVETRGVEGDQAEVPGVHDRCDVILYAFNGGRVVFL